MACQSRYTLIFLLGLLAVVPGYGRFAGAEEAKAPDIAGTWVGTLDLGAAKLRLVFDLTKKDGGLAGTLDSPDQGAFGLKIDEVTREKNAVKFTLKMIGGSYAGELAADGKEIKGTWKQGPLSLPLVLKPGEKVGPPKRPQEPKEPLPYHSEEVKFVNKAAGITFAGTLTLPKQGGPFPAVLLDLRLRAAGSQRRAARAQAVPGAGRLSDSPRHRRAAGR